jgi:hypothetical protein
LLEGPTLGYVIELAIIRGAMAPLAPLVPAPLHFLKAIFDFFEPLFFKN